MAVAALLTTRPERADGPIGTFGLALPGAGEGSAEGEQGHQVAERRAVAGYVRLWRRVRQVVLAEAGQRGQAPVLFDELQDRDVVVVGVVDRAVPRPRGHHDQR